MSQTYLEQLWQQIIILPIEEQKQLQQRLSENLSETATEEEFEQMLLAEGLLVANNKLMADSNSNSNLSLNRTPIKNTGKPLSQMIIEERR